jgi:hypothetical protein
MSSSTDLKERLQQAAAVVEDAGLPDDLRPIAFDHALEALGVVAAPASTDPQPRLDGGARTIERGASQISGGELLGRIASVLRQDADVVARVYEEDEGQIRLIVKRSMFLEPDRKAASIRHVALLVTVGRQAAGIEEHTSFDTIRDECRELKVFDASNFATEVGKLEFRTTGGRNSKEARANRHHYDEAADLIRRMTEAAES